MTDGDSFPPLDAYCWEVLAAFAVRPLTRNYYGSLAWRPLLYRRYLKEHFEPSRRSRYLAITEDGRTALAEHRRTDPTTHQRRDT
jgi:hypothetical protein